MLFFYSVVTHRHFPVQSMLSLCCTNFAMFPDWAFKLGYTIPHISAEWRILLLPHSFQIIVRN